VEVGSVSAGSLAQSTQANSQQEVSRSNQQQQRQAELEIPASEQSSPQSGQRVGSVVDLSV
jgi:hypothetical protein